MLTGENQLLKYNIRQGSEKMLKLLAAKYQLILVIQMKYVKYQKFKEYFEKKGIEFDAVYKDFRKEFIKTPQDYSQIFMDFEFNQKCSNSCIILTTHDSDLEISAKHQQNSMKLFNSLNMRQIPINNSENFPKYAIIVLPHMKIQSSYVNMEHLTKSIEKIINLLQTNNDFNKGISPKDKAQEKSTKSPTNIQRSFHVPAMNSKKSPSKKSLKDLVLEKFSCLNKEFNIYYTDYVYQHTKEIIKFENTLLSHYNELQNKRKSAIDHEKTKTTKTEIMNDLMNKKLEAYTCLHLANQYSKIVESVYGKLSEAAMLEINDENLPTKSHYSYLSDFFNKANEESFNSLILILNTPHFGGASRQPETILSEPYNAPYLQLNMFFPKKPMVAAPRKKSFDPDLDGAPTSEIFSIVVKKKT